MDLELKLSEFVEEYRAIRSKFHRRRDRLVTRAAGVFEKLAGTPQVKFLLSVEGQQYCFTTSLCLLLVTFYTVWNRPYLFKYLYGILITSLIVARGIVYFKQHWGPFMFDFCYFANLLALLSAFGVVDASHTAFMVINGPVLWAIVMWRNSIVFHSLDKMTSFAIHFLPALCTYVQRWSLSEHKTQPSFSLSTCLLGPLGFYLGWQFCYTIVFDVIMQENFRKDESLESALRWFTRKDKHSALTVGALVACRKLRIFQPSEEFDSFLWKTKLVFYTVQFIYTVVTLPLAWLSYSSQTTHAFMLAVSFVYATNSGASFYLSHAYVRQRLAKAADLADKKAKEMEKVKHKEGEDDRVKEKDNEKGGEKSDGEVTIVDDKPPQPLNVPPSPSPRQQQQQQQHPERTPSSARSAPVSPTDKEGSGRIRTDSVDDAVMVSKSDWNDGNHHHDDDDEKDKSHERNDESGVRRRKTGDVRDGETDENGQSNDVHGSMDGVTSVVGSDGVKHVVSRTLLEDLEDVFSTGDPEAVILSEEDDDDVSDDEVRDDVEDSIGNSDNGNIGNNGNHEDDDHGKKTEGNSSGS